MANSTLTSPPNPIIADPPWKLPGWAEPVIVLTILLSSMIVTRRRGFQIFDRRRNARYSPLENPDSPRWQTERIQYDAEDEDSQDDYSSISKNPPKRRSCFGASFRTPNTSRFANTLQSRILQKFPFLIEMFYWIINYLFYRMTRVLSQQIFSKLGVWDVAQGHGLAVLWVEQSSFLRFLFPVHEKEVQQWFLNGHQSALTILNRVYALIHIPGTVGFIAWFYYLARTHATFAIVRRTMTLTNFMAFMIFTLYPCMPPRLLPEEYGFIDSVRHDNAQSVWMRGDYVNSLAAMPSMHFGYSFAIGCTMIYYSGIFRYHKEKGEPEKALFWKLFYLVLGIGYPSMILVTIVATANHYWLDAIAAVAVVCFAFLFNRVLCVLLPIEDYLMWALRMNKPVPTTGARFR